MRNTKILSGLRFFRFFLGNFYKDISLKNRVAESLVEVIIAIFVVSIGSSVATSLIVNALQANSFSRDNLIALNLAEEGIEAMRSIRDNNWLKNGSDKETCWNLLPGKNCPPANPTQDLLKNAYYTVELDKNYVWQIEEQPKALDTVNVPAADNKFYQLQIVDRDGSLFFTPNQLNPAYKSVTSNPQFGRFYRMIQVMNFDPKNPDLMDIRSTVMWIEHGKSHIIVLDSTLTNYQKVKR